MTASNERRRERERENGGPGAPPKPRRQHRPDDLPAAVRGARRQERSPRRTRPPREEPPRRPPFRGRGHAPEQSFKCGHCKRFVGLLPSGGHHRNHCPFCLYSRHVDERQSGDRASTCGSVMRPIGAFQRPNGEHVIVHRCLGCGFERFNRIAADDDFDLVLALPVLPARSARREGKDFTIEGTEV
jgi:RNHCP domain